MRSVGSMTVRTESAVVAGRQRSKLLVRVACLYVLTVPFDLFAIDSLGGRTATVPAALLLLFVWLNDLGASRRTLPSFPAVAFWLLVYSGWCLTTALWSVNPQATLLNWTSLTLQMIVAYVLADSLRGRWRSALWAYVFGAAVLAVVLLANPLNEERGGRGSVGGADENITAFVLCIGVAAAIYLMLESSGARRPVFAMLLALLIGAGVVYTGSRTGFLSLVGILLIATLLIRGRISIGRRALMIASIGPAYLLLRSQGLIPERLHTVFADAVAQQDSGRADIVAMYVAHMSEWMMTGIGFGSDADFLFQASGTYRNAHSMFWKTWIELGVVGLVLLGAVILVLLFQGRRAPTGRVTLLMMSPIVLFAITLGGQTSNSLWFAVALALVIPESDGDNSVDEGRVPRSSREKTSENSTTRATD